MFEKQMKNIQLLHEGEDYILISFIDEEGEYSEVEITGYFAIKAIKALGKGLHKESFLKNSKDTPRRLASLRLASLRLASMRLASPYCPHINNRKNDCNCPLFHYYGDSSEETQDNV